MPSEPPPLPSPWDLVCELAEALTWCAYSADFGPTGRHRDAWVTTIKPLLDRAAREQVAAERAAMERTTGLEPATSALGKQRSTIRAASAGDTAVDTTLASFVDRAMRAQVAVNEALELAKKGGGK